MKRSVPLILTPHLDDAPPAVATPTTGPPLTASQTPRQQEVTSQRERHTLDFPPGGSNHNGSARSASKTQECVSGISCGEKQQGEVDNEQAAVHKNIQSGNPAEGRMGQVHPEGTSEKQSVEISPGVDLTVRGLHCEGGGTREESSRNRQETGNGRADNTIPGTLAVKMAPTPGQDVHLELLSQADVREEQTSSHLEQNFKDSEVSKKISEGAHNVLQDEAKLHLNVPHHEEHPREAGGPATEHLVRDNTKETRELNPKHQEEECSVETREPTPGDEDKLCSKDTGEPTAEHLDEECPQEAGEQDQEPVTEAEDANPDELDEKRSLGKRKLTLTDLDEECSEEDGEHAHELSQSLKDTGEQETRELDKEHCEVTGEPIDEHLEKESSEEKREPAPKYQDEERSGFKNLTKELFHEAEEPTSKDLNKEPCRETGEPPPAPESTDGSSRGTSAVSGDDGPRPLLGNSESSPGHLESSRTPDNQPGEEPSLQKVSPSPDKNVSTPGEAESGSSGHQNVESQFLKPGETHQESEIYEMVTQMSQMTLYSPSSSNISFKFSEEPSTFFQKLGSGGVKNTEQEGLKMEPEMVPVASELDKDLGASDPPVEKLPGTFQVTANEENVWDDQPLEDNVRGTSSRNSDRSVQEAFHLQRPKVIMTRETITNMLFHPRCEGLVHQENLQGTSPDKPLNVCEDAEPTRDTSSVTEEKPEDLMSVKNLRGTSSDPNLMANEDIEPAGDTPVTEEKPEDPKLEVDEDVEPYTDINTAKEKPKDSTNMENLTGTSSNKQSDASKDTKPTGDPVTAEEKPKADFISVKNFGGTSSDLKLEVMFSEDLADGTILDLQPNVSTIKKMALCETSQEPDIFEEPQDLDALVSSDVANISMQPLDMSSPLDLESGTTLEVDSGLVLDLLPAEDGGPLDQELEEDPFEEPGKGKKRWRCYGKVCQGLWCRCACVT